MNMEKLTKNDEIEIKITGMTSDGWGVGRFGELAVFVPKSIEGETVRTHIIKVKKNYAVGRFVCAVEQSPHRIESDCPEFGRCGGCAFRHMDYGEECRIKRERVAQAVRRIGGIDTPVDSIIPCDMTEHYRNKAQYPVREENGEIRIGFFAQRSHRICDCAACKLQNSEFEPVIECFKEWIRVCGVSAYDESCGSGELRHIYIRRAHATGEIMVCAVINKDKITSGDTLVGLLQRNVPGLKSVIVNYNMKNTNVVLGERFETLWGEDAIEDVLCGRRLKISPQSFYQVNSEQCEKLYEIAGKYAALTGEERLVDVYCGIGSIALSISDGAREIYGFEIVPQAVENAKENASINGIPNAEFFCSDAADALKRIRDKGKIDVAVLDPPRKGCDEKLISDVVRAAPERIVYVSCDPATLARDLQIFSRSGYSVEKITPVDMFPRTAHVESVVLITRA